MGIVNVLFVLLLTDACELKAEGGGVEMYDRIPQEEHVQDEDGVGDVAKPSQPNTAASADIEAASPSSSPRSSLPPPLPPSKPKSWPSRATSAFSSALSQISAPTRKTMYKLWFLLIIDSLADGMVPYSLTTYYMDLRFHPSKSTLGDVTSLSYFLGGIGAVFAGPLARRIGLINTMVFTHVPSSTAVLLFPLAPRFWITALFLLIRTGLNNMDQAPRSAFIAAVVKPQERTAVMGITAMLRNLAAMTGPTVTGWLAEGNHFGVAFIAAGICRLGYDFGLWALFVGYERGKRLQDRGGDDDDEEDENDSPAQEMRNTFSTRARARDGTDEAAELESLAASDELDGDIDERKGVSGEKRTSQTARAWNGGLHVPEGDLGRVRSRSPHSGREND
jgi:hypothetical protein